MATVRKIERPACEIKSFDAEKKCSRQANYEVSWIGSNGNRRAVTLCYRHRFRAFDVVMEVERSYTSQSSRAEP